MSYTSKISAMLLVGLTLGFPIAAVAQTPAVNTANIVAECAISALRCQLAVEQAIAALQALGLTPEELNTQLGVLAGAALDGAQNLPAAEKVQLAGMITTIREASTDPEQIAALNDLAGQLETGGDINLDAFAQAISNS